MAIGDAGPAMLGTWNEHTVAPPGGHVLQSREWARHRARRDWRALQLDFGDGFALLALVRPWPMLGGGGAYLPRGPIPAGEPPGRTAERVIEAAHHLGERGIDVVAADPEIGASTDYAERLRTAGFRAIEELQPSRHRMRLGLGPTVDEAAAMGGFAKATRQRIRAAERAGVRVSRYDTRRTEDSAGAAGSDREGDPPVAELDRAGIALATFHDLLVSTGDRRGFRFWGRADALAWWTAAFGAGLLILLEATDPDGAVVAGLVLYRHGRRLSTVHSGDRPATRRDFPGALHLLRWRALQLAIREGCDEMDFGGVDVEGCRRIPVPGEPMFGLYEHKRSFGATWVELAGAHELVLRPRRYLAGRGLARLRRALPGA